MNNINEKLKNLNKILPKRNDVNSFECDSSIPFKTFDFISALLWRIDNLLNTIYNIKEDTSSSLTLAKDLVQSIAILWHLSMKIESLSFTKNTKAFEKELKTILFEYRDTELLSIVSSLSATKPELKSSFDHVLEYVYPNFSGTHGLYSKMNMQEYYIQYDKDINESKLDNKSKILSTINIALDIVQDTYEKIENKKQEFIDIFK